MSKIAVFNHKGGVGKTTISTHIAFKCQMMNYPINFIDLDPQQNAINYLSGYNYDDNEDYYNLKLNDGSGNILVTANTDILNENINDYVIDLPPDYNAGYRMLNSLKVDLLIVPLDGRFSIVGADKVIEMAKKFINNDNILIVRNKVMPNDNLTKQEIKEIKLLGANIYPEGIPSHNVFRRAENKGVPAWAVPYGISTKACRIMDSLTDAIVNKYFKLKTFKNLGV